MTTRSSLLLPLAVIAGFTAPLFLAGCEDIAKSIEDEVGGKVKDEVIREGGKGNVAGSGNEQEEEEPTELEPEIDITNIQPQRGSTVGGDLIEIIGFGFRPGMVVEFGPGRVRADPAFVDITETRITLRTPPYPEPAFVTVRVRAEDEDFGTFEENGFSYFEPVVVTRVDPDRGPAAGGQLVHIIGAGFVDGTVVQFGPGEAVPAEVVDSRTLQVASPARPGGIYALTVTNLNGSDTLAGAYQYYEPVSLAGVEPFAGPLQGGTPITVQGTGLVEPTALFMGSQILFATASADESRLFATTLPSISGEGPVDVTVENDNGRFTLPGGFVFYDPADTDRRIVSVSPSSSLVEGGRVISIVVGGFPGEDLRAYIGDAQLDCVVHDAHTLTCTVPPGAEGSADVRVADGTGAEVVRPGGFLYVDLQLHTVVPSTGAQAGGTYVRLFGKGFAAPAEVYFGGRPAVDVTVESSTEMTLRTPPGEPGGVNVRIVTQGVEITSRNFFTYFDPFTSPSFVSGEIIDGSVNVLVVGGNGAPIDNAIVVVGDEVDPVYKPHLYGFTDFRGQITISGPDVVGPQNIHAGRTDHGGFSLIQINRNVVTMLLLEEPPPPPDPLPECPQGGPGAPPLVTGKVRRVKDKWNTGTDYVQMTTTYESFSTPLPDPGPNSVLVSQGEYELWARTGDLVVIAMAGLQSGGYLDVHALGFHAFLNLEMGSGLECNTANEGGDCEEKEQCVGLDRLSADFMPPVNGNGYCTRVYEGVEVVVDTPVNQPMRIDLIDPPYARTSDFEGTAPNAVKTFVYYDFGFQGMHPMDQLVLSATNAVYIDMPKRLPEAVGTVPFSVQIGLRYQDSAGDLYPPFSDVRLDNLTDTSKPIVIGCWGENCLPERPIAPILKTQLVTAAGMTSECTATTESLCGQTAGCGWRQGACVPTRMRFGYKLRPTDIPDPPVTATMNVMYDVEYQVPCEGAFPMPVTPIRWIANAPGDVTSFFVPIFPGTAAGANIPNGEHGWQIDSVYTPGADFQSFDMSLYDGWRSDALTGVGFSTP